MQERIPLDAKMTHDLKSLRHYGSARAFTPGTAARMLILTTSTSHTFFVHQVIAIIFLPTQSSSSPLTQSVPSAPSTLQGCAANSSTTRPRGPRPQTLSEL